MQHYVITRNTTELTSTILPEVTEYTDSIATFAMGEVLVYKIKTINYAGNSSDSVDLIVTVGQEPNSPTNLRVITRLSETEVEIKWDEELAITDNLETLFYRVYVDDLSGNTVEPIVSTGSQKIISGLTRGAVYEVKVSTINLIGESPLSNALTLYAGLVP